jgi:hypothetical protein
VCGYSEDGKTVYFDRALPRYANINGRTVDIWQHVADHEMLEKTILMRYGNEHYQGAHTIATYWENACVKAEGVDADAYEKWFAPVIESVGKRERYEEVPADLDLTPYYDSGDEKLIERMTFVKDVGNEVEL